MACRTFYAVLLIMISQACTAASELVVRHVPSEDIVDARKSYFVDLLALTLSKSEDKFGPFKLVETNVHMYQRRSAESLKAGKHIDVAWMATNSEREEKLLPVRIPLMKGLLGFRVMIIDRNKPDLLAHVKDKEDLYDFEALQGHDWPDVPILRHNGINVVTDDRYLALFDLIEQNRYDYFPRGMLEAWAELEEIPNKNLIIDSHILFIYPSPIYFFVSKENIKLARRLEFGLTRAIEDGSFEHLLRTHPAHKKAFEELNIDNRKVFHMENPDLPAATPLGIPAYWYQYSDLVDRRDSIDK